MSATETTGRPGLPFAELEAAARCLLDTHGSRSCCRDATRILAAREIDDVRASAATGDDRAVRARLRQIAGGSLRAGRLDKALAAKFLELSPRRDRMLALLPREQALALSERPRHRPGSRRGAERRDNGSGGSHIDGKLTKRIVIPGFQAPGD